MATLIIWAALMITLAIALTIVTALRVAALRVMYSAGI